MTLGDTAPLLTIRHEWSAPVERERAYPSRVFVKRDGSEQRLSLSGTPTDVLTYRLLSPGSFDALQLAALPTLATDTIVRMPRWEDEARVASPGVTAGASTVPCDPSNKPTFVSGVQVLLWRDPVTYEVAVLNTVGGSSVTTVSPLTLSWGAGTIVVPITPVRLTLPLELTHWAPTSGALSLVVSTSLSDIAGVGTGGSASTATPYAISVTSVIVVPRGGRSPIAAAVTDSAGDPITSDAIVWTSSDPTNAPVWATPDARVAIVGNPNGLLTAATITATLGALSDTGTANLTA